MQYRPTPKQIKGLRLIEQGMEMFFIDSESRRLLTDYHGVRDLILAFDNSKSRKSKMGDRYGLKYAFETGTKVTLCKHNPHFKSERTKTIKAGKAFAEKKSEEWSTIKFKKRDYSGHSEFWFEEYFE